MKIFIDKGSGFKIHGEIDHPETIKQIRERFEEYIDVDGDVFFSGDDLPVYHDEFIPFLDKTGPRQDGQPG